jgi:hypothetical protein
MRAPEVPDYRALKRLPRGRACLARSVRDPRNASCVSADIAANESPWKLPVRIWTNQHWGAAVNKLVDKLFTCGSDRDMCGASYSQR